MGDAQKSYKKLMCEEWNTPELQMIKKKKKDKAVNFLGFVLVKAVFLY